MIDVLIVVAVVALTLMIARPTRHVRGLIDAETRTLKEMAELTSRLEAHRNAVLTDTDDDGVGEFAALGAVLAERTSQFEQVGDTDVWSRGGYYFTVRLPGPKRQPLPAADPSVVADFAEVAYLLIAWPTEPGETGMRAYHTAVYGTLQHAVDGYPYGGADRPPVPPIKMVYGPRENPTPGSAPNLGNWAVPTFDVSGR